jgi:phosphoribosyl-ATP pyrophosphohydrolase
MNDILKELYEVVLSRRQTPAEDSYTCYLFREGLDKILKKCGEECAETIIAAKNLAAVSEMDALTNEAARARFDLENEICDLLYHLLVLMAQQDVPLEAVENILRERSQKIGNLKRAHTSARGIDIPPEILGTDK